MGTSVWRIKKLGYKQMNFRESIEFLLNEIELNKTMIADKNIKKSCDIVRSFLNHIPIGSFNNSIQVEESQKNLRDFCDDDEKMSDFNLLSKDEFLNSYSYISETEYNLTRIKLKNS